MIQSGNWRVARDTVWKLEGARDTVWKLEGARDAGNASVQNIENLKFGTSLIPTKSSGTGTDLEFRSGPNWNVCIMRCIGSAEC